MSSTKVRFNICGSTYIISTTDTEEYVLSLAEKLEKDMGKTMQQTPSASTATAAVITALDYLDEMKKAEDSAANMRAQIKAYLEDAAKSKLEVEDANNEIERLRREVAYLRQQAAAAAQRAASIAGIQQAAAKMGQTLTPQQAAQLAAQRARQQQMARGVQQQAAGQPMAQPMANQPAAAPKLSPMQQPAQPVQASPMDATAVFEIDTDEEMPAIPPTMNTIEFDTEFETLLDEN